MCVCIFVYSLYILYICGQQEYARICHEVCRDLLQSGEAAKPAVKHEKALDTSTHRTFKHVFRTKGSMSYSDAAGSHLLAGHHRGCQLQRCRCPLSRRGSSSLHSLLARTSISNCLGCSTASGLGGQSSAVLKLHRL